MTSRALPLACAALVLASLAAACASGAKADGATVIGRIQDEAGTGIGGATVLLDGDSTSTSGNGAFTFAAKKGTSVLDVTADGYRRVSVELRIANGDNLVDITLVVCTPVIDAGCEDEPTPTPTATPPNVLASFSGVNSNVDGVPPEFGNWTGSAALDGAANTLNLGNDADMTVDLAFAECWQDSAETNDYDGAGTPDHCVFWWEGEDQGGIVNPALDDAVFYVSIPGAEFTAGNTLTFADGMTAGYYEGDFTVDGFRIAEYTLQRPATEGSLQLGNVGLSEGQAVSITGQATFYIPELP